MACEHLRNLTPEELVAAKIAAQAERERLIQQAINNGASVNYMTSRLRSDEQETHILTYIDGSCIIDTTNPTDIKLCIKRGWKITSVTYYTDTNQVAGMTFVGKANGISIRNVR